MKAISGAKDVIHIIDQKKCTKCGTCFEVCPQRFAAVTKIPGVKVPEPVAAGTKVNRKRGDK